jgi:hypothetical protein
MSSASRGANFGADKTFTSSRENEMAEDLLDKTPALGSSPDNPMWARPVREALFVNDTEIMRRLGIGDDAWPSVRTYLEREGLPKKDHIIRKRYWPAIEAWLNQRYGAGGHEYVPPDGKDNFDEPSPRTYQRLRRIKE